MTIHFPSAISGTWTVAGVTVRGSDLSILIIVPITLIALTWFLERTTLGRTVKACASNPRLARLVEHQPQSGLDVGVGSGGGAVHPFGHPDRRPERCGGRPDHPRTANPVARLWSLPSSAA